MEIVAQTQLGRNRRQLFGAIRHQSQCVAVVAQCVQNSVRFGMEIGFWRVAFVKGPPIAWA